MTDTIDRTDSPRHDRYVGLAKAAEWHEVDGVYRPEHPRRPALERRNDMGLDRRGFEASGQPPRRAADRRTHGTAKPRTSGGFLARFRQPIIGLTMVGVAAPIALNATSASPSGGTGDESTTPATSAVPQGDVEENVAGHVAESAEAVEREQTVKAAMARFGIDMQLAGDIYDIAREEGIEPKVAYGLVKTESTFRNEATSHVGAVGLTQLMPRTAAWLEPGTSVRDLRDQRTNLRIGFRYLDQLIEKYKGDTRTALLAYNRGPGTVDNVLKRGGNPDNGYAEKVLRS